MELTPEQRQEILGEIHRREFLEKAAIEQEKKAREAEAERYHREELARVAQRQEDERRERLTNNLTQCLDLLQKVIQSFSEKNEVECYRLLARLTPSLNSTMHQLNRPAERPIVVGIPTVRVKADNAMGFAIINAEDLTPAHEILEDAE